MPKRVILLLVVSSLSVLAILVGAVYMFVVFVEGITTSIPLNPRSVRVASSVFLLLAPSAIRVEEVPIPQLGIAVGWSLWHSLTRDGKRLAFSRDSDGAIRLCSLDGSNEIMFVRPHGRGQNYLLAPDNERLATFSDDGTLKIWNTITGAEVLSLRDDSWGALQSLTWTRSGEGAVGDYQR